MVHETSGAVLRNIDDVNKSDNKCDSYSLVSVT